MTRHSFSPGVKLVETLLGNTVVHAERRHWYAGHPPPFRCWLVWWPPLFSSGGYGLSCLYTLVRGSVSACISCTISLDTIGMQRSLFSPTGEPWSLDSPWSAITAWTMLGIYLLLNAKFLQPYLGDAARYFRVSPANIAGQRQIRREAVQLLEDLHLSGKYDRIIVVAHSLGTVIAYDMLRAYFSRICGQLPATAKELKVNIAAIERDPPPSPDELRRRGREMVALWPNWQPTRPQGPV